MERKYRGAARIIPLRKELHRLKQEWRKDFSEEEDKVWDDAFDELRKALILDFPDSSLYEEFKAFDLQIAEAHGHKPRPIKKRIVRTYNHKVQLRFCNKCGVKSGAWICTPCQYKTINISNIKLGHRLQRKYNKLLPTVTANIDRMKSRGYVVFPQKPPYHQYDWLFVLGALLRGATHSTYPAEQIIDAHKVKVSESKVSVTARTDGRMDLCLSEEYFIPKWMLDLAQTISSTVVSRERIQVVRLGLSGDTDSVYRYIGLLELEKECNW